MKKFIFTIIIFLCPHFLHAMDVDVHQQVEQEDSTEVIWIQTSDRVLIEVSFWQIEQMGKLHKFYLLQSRYKGQNSKENPLLSLGLTVDQMMLLQNALSKAYSAQDFEIFCSKLTPEQQDDLVNTAGTVGAMGLTALLMTFIFPLELQQKLLNPFDIIAPAFRFLTGNRYFKIDTGYIVCAAFSHDGKYIVSGLSDGSIILWDIITGKQLQTFYEQKVSCLAFSHDNNSIIIGSTKNEGDLFILNIKTGKKTKITNDFPYGSPYPWYFFPQAIAWSVDGNYILMGDYGGDVILLARDQKSTLYLRHPRTQNDSRFVRCLAFSSNGKEIVACLDDGTIFLSDIKDEKKRELKTNLFHIRSVLLSHDNKYLILGLENDALIKLNIITAEQIELVGAEKKYEGYDRYNALFALNDNNYVVADSRFKKNVLGLRNVPDKVALKYMTESLTIPQACFIYRLYLAKINNFLITMNNANPDYAIYASLPERVQKVIDFYLLPRILTPNVQDQKISSFISTYFQEKLNVVKNLITTYKKELFMLGGLAIAAAAYKYWIKK